MQEQEQNDELSEVEQVQSNEIKQLEDVINALKNDMETLRWQKKRLRNEIDLFDRKIKAEKQATNQHEASV